MLDCSQLTDEIAPDGTIIVKLTPNWYSALFAIDKAAQHQNQLFLLLYTANECGWNCVVDGLSEEEKPTKEETENVKDLKASQAQVKVKARVFAQNIFNEVKKCSSRIDFERLIASGKLEARHTDDKSTLLLKLFAFANYL